VKEKIVELSKTENHQDKGTITYIDKLTRKVAASAFPFVG
jgi:hypothetical protein